MLPDTETNRQHATYLQMLGLATVEDAVRIRVSAEHLEEAADYLRLMGVSWEVYIEDVSQYLVRAPGANYSLLNDTECRKTCQSIHFKIL